MIENDQQYRITEGCAEEFQKVLIRLAHAPLDGLPPEMRKLQIDAARSQLADLKYEMMAYRVSQHLRAIVGELAGLNVENLPTITVHFRHQAMMNIPTYIIHVLVDEQALCKFTTDPFPQWPFGHIGVSLEQYPATKAACEDPTHMLHTVFGYKMCDGCSQP